MSPQLERPRLAARDAHEIAHRDVHVDHMHAPFGGEVAGDIVDARVLGVAVHGEREIREAVVGARGVDEVRQGDERGRDREIVG